MPVPSRRFLPVRFAAAALIAAAMLVPAHAQEDTGTVTDADTVVATVNGAPVTEGEIELAMSDLDSQFQALPLEQRRAAALSVLIELRLMAAESERAGIDESPDFVRRMAFLRERALHSAFVENEIAGAITEEEVQARYDREVGALEPTPEVRAAHILVETEEEARQIIAELDAGGDFAELAREHSSDNTAQRGGDLGYFSRGRMVPDFEEAAFALEAGAHSSEPVQTQFGWHVIRVEDSRTQPPPALEDVEEQLRSLLVRERYFERVTALRDAAEIDITDPELRSALDEEEEAGPENGEAPPQ